MSVGRFLQQAAAGNAGGAVYVDDVFSTYLYEGLQPTEKTVDNGIDLDGEGGLVWIKKRSDTGQHELFDTERGATKTLRSNLSNAEATRVESLKSFNSNGFTVGNDTVVNSSGTDFVSWTFRKQPGFFDVVTYTGTGSAQTINHSLGSAPGMIIVKDLNVAYNWMVYHRSLGGYNYYLHLNTTDGRFNNSSVWQSEPTNSTFSVGHSWNNNNGSNYVAYLFAHDAQDFGTDSDESIIKCGSFTTDGSGNASVDLGFEPQWIFAKTSASANQWVIADTMRGLDSNGTDADKHLWANSNNAEMNYSFGHPTATGFEAKSLSGSQAYIYVAIRRPHKPAEEFAATNLFKTVTGRNDGVSPSYETGFVTDMGIQRRPATTESNLIFSRLTGPKYYDTDNNTDAEATGSNIVWDYMNGALSYFSSAAYRFWGWKRAPGFFDAVAYTGTGSARTIPHNLGAVPEMIWVVNRSYAERKAVYTKETGNQKWLDLTYTYTGNADSAGAYWNSTTPTESVFSVGNQGRVNGNNFSYVAFLFATVAGISKIGSYTGTGSSDINIDCGFSSGARFVLIKCIGGNAAGNHWYLFDSERGIATGNDPYIVLDDTSTSAYGVQDAIDPLSSGFKVRSTAVDGINANGGTYLFYAIA